MNQTTPNDNWTLGCRPENPGQSELPGEARTRLTTSRPRRAWSRSTAATSSCCRRSRAWPTRSIPTRKAQIVWQYRIGQGSGLGGQWGGAVDEQQAYFGVSDLLSPKPGGIRAVNLATGAARVERRAAGRGCATEAADVPRVAGRGGHRDSGRGALRLARRRHARLLHARTARSSGPSTPTRSSRPSTA